MKKILIVVLVIFVIYIISEDHSEDMNKALGVPSYYDKLGIDKIGSNSNSSSSKSNDTSNKSKDNNSSSSKTKDSTSKSDSNSSSLKTNVRYNSTYNPGWHYYVDYFEFYSDGTFNHYFETESDVKTVVGTYVVSGNTVTVTCKHVDMITSDGTREKNSCEAIWSYKITGHRITELDNYIEVGDDRIEISYEY